MEGKIKTLIVDDSLFIRVMLKKLLEKHKDVFEVIGSVINGLEALEFVKKNKDIDLITMDIKMPVMDGLKAVEEILKVRKIPIVMISSATKENADVTVESLELGAIDFINKSTVDNNMNFFDYEEEIIFKLIGAANANVPNKIFRKSKETVDKSTKRDVKKIICIGASTGGPNALKQVLRGLEKDFNYPIVVAQHMPKGPYSESLAQNLDDNIYNKVKILEHGEVIENNKVYICPGGLNAELVQESSKVVAYLNNVKSGYYMPSVDVLFNSFSKIKNVEKVAIVMTGMGSDGLIGAIELYKNGCIIVAESEESCVVYGMPKKIAESNEIKEKLIFNLEGIKKYLNSIQ